MKNTTPADPISAIKSHTTNGYIRLSLAMSFTHGNPAAQSRIRKMKRDNGRVYSPCVIRLVKETDLRPTKRTERSARQRLQFSKDQIEKVIEELKTKEVRGRIHRLVAARICWKLNKSLGHYIGKPPKRLSHFYKSGRCDCFVAQSLYEFLRDAYVKPEPKQSAQVSEVNLGKPFGKDGVVAIPFWLVLERPGTGKRSLVIPPPSYDKLEKFLLTAVK